MTSGQLAALTVIAVLADHTFYNHDPVTIASYHNDISVVRSGYNDSQFFDAISSTRVSDGSYAPEPEEYEDQYLEWHSVTGECPSCADSRAGASGSTLGSRRQSD